MKPLKGLVAYPVVRPDGTINNKLGYDEETCTFYAPGKSPMPPVSDNPTPLEIDRAKRLILNEVYGEFNFRIDGKGWDGRPVSASLCHAILPSLAALYDKPDEPYGPKTALPGPGWLSWVW